jgi:hypothetical protein
MPGRRTRVSTSLLRRMISALFTAAVIDAATICGDAQEQPGSAYAMAGIAFPHQNGVTGEESQTYVTAPGGTTRSWTCGAGVFVRRRLSIEGEVSRTGMMRAREPSRYNTTFIEERRDGFFAGNVRFHLRPGSHADLEPVAGLLVTRHQGWSQSEYVLAGTPPQIRTTPRVSVGLPTSLGLNTGVDLRVGGRHIAVVPSLRLRWRFAIFGDNRNFSWYPNGFPHWTLSAAVAARIEF